MSCPLRCFLKKSSHVGILQGVPGPQGLRVERGLTPHKPTIFVHKETVLKRKRKSLKVTQPISDWAQIEPRIRAEVWKAFWKLPLWLQLQTQLPVTSFKRSSSQRKQQPRKICSRKLTEAAANQLPGKDTFVRRKCLEMVEIKNLDLLTGSSSRYHRVLKNHQWDYVLEDLTSL